MKETVNTDNTKLDTPESKLTIWKFLLYFIIYSILGLIVEVIFCAATWGIVQNRQSFLYGPFCAIYGVGALFLILSLQRFKKSKVAVFLFGFIVGSIVEYLISYLGEVFFNMRWWDYSNEPFNLNGRICLVYSLMWSVISLLIIYVLNPKLDKFIDYLKDKIGIKWLQTITYTLTVFLLVDVLLTCFAVNMFLTRLIKTYNFELQYSETTLNICSKLYENPTIDYIVYKFFSDEKMMITFPNIRALDKNGNIVHISGLLPHTKTYYFMIYDKKY